MTTKRFMKFQFIFVILLILTLVCNTFAWANRPKVQGGGYTTEQKGYHTAIELVTPTNGYYINGNECTAVTYEGTYDKATGIITYDENIVISPTSDNNLTLEFTGNNGTYHYFKTVITNPSDVATTVSLFINGQIPSTLDNLIKYHVYSPIVRESDIASGKEGNTRTIDFFPLMNNYEINPKGTANIEWCIYKPNNSTDDTFVITDIILSNN